MLEKQKNSHHGGTDIFNDKKLVKARRSNKNND